MTAVKGEVVQTQLFGRCPGREEPRPGRDRRGRILRTPDLSRRLPVRRSFPKPLPPVLQFGYNPQRSQPSGSAQLALSGGSAFVFVGLYCDRPAG